MIPDKRFVELPKRGGDIFLRNPDSSDRSTGARMGATVFRRGGHGGEGMVDGCNNKNLTFRARRLNSWRNLASGLAVTPICQTGMVRLRFLEITPGGESFASLVSINTGALSRL
jgi:hypothetical protein